MPIGLQHFAPDAKHGLSAAQGHPGQGVRLVRLAIDIIRTRHGVLLLSAVAVCAVASLLRVIPFGRAVKDYLFILDGAYRIGLGQVPHVDFSSPIGPLTLYLTWLATRMFPAGQPFVGLHALMWLAFLPPLLGLAPRFRSAVHFAAAAGLLAGMVLLPFTVDQTHLSEISYFAVYNRFATGGLFLIGLWYVLPKRPWDAALIGYLLALLLLLKITAAAAAGALLLAAVLLRRTTALTAAGAVIAAAGLCSLPEVTNGVVSAYLRDAVALGAINAGRGLYNLLAAAIRNWSVLAATLLVVGLALRDLRGRPPAAELAPVVGRDTFTVDLVLLVAVALIAESQNTGGIGLLASAAAAFHGEVATQRPARLAASVVVIALLVAPFGTVAVDRTVTALVRERAGTTDHAFSALLPGMRVPLPTLEGARLFRQISHEWLPLAEQIQSRRFNLTNDPTDNAPAALAAWAEDVVDAAAVFRSANLATTASRYATLAFADPYPRLLGLTPARGVSLVMHVDRTVGHLDLQGASGYLRGADGVFVTTCELTNGEMTNRAVFDVILATEFERHRLNACWDFHSRKAERRP
jgi:hypothetical protein